MNLTAFLVSNKVYFQFLKKRPTRHAFEASQVSGVTLSEIVKTIVFVDQDSQPLVAVVRGDCNVSRHKMERCSNSKSVRLADDDAAKAATGYPTGGIPPVGHKKKLPVFMDKGVVSCNYVWCGGGARSKLVRLKTEDIVKLSSAKICDISTV
jgi:Cys-tRNA(Pro) deacylase